MTKLLKLCAVITLLGAMTINAIPCKTEVPDKPTPEEKEVKDIKSAPSTPRPSK